MRRKKIIAT